MAGKLSDYNEKTTRQKYARSEKYSAFKQSIWVRSYLAFITFCTPNLLSQDVQHESDEPMPPLVELIPKGQFHLS